ncbi:hypothetical protein [Phaeacidiphilus oryzae]|uniref:hypothetical protein n=1 Tax=Phaeacidiphilus oryzae TaxID=348818 RepID=UPI00056919A0|nr:hypothetical protein [Phaeacidiphilus oryzae]
MNANLPTSALPSTAPGKGRRRRVEPPRPFSSAAYSAERERREETILSAPAEGVGPAGPDRPPGPLGYFGEEPIFAELAAAWAEAGRCVPGRREQDEEWARLTSRPYFAPKVPPIPRAQARPAAPAPPAAFGPPIIPTGWTSAGPTATASSAPPAQAFAAPRPPAVPRMPGPGPGLPRRRPYPPARDATIAFGLGNAFGPALGPTLGPAPVSSAAPTDPPTGDGTSTGACLG